MVQSDQPVTDDEKHAFCRERTGFIATILPRSLYNAAEQAGFDMRWYVYAKPVPIPSSSPVGSLFAGGLPGRPSGGNSSVS